MRHFVALEQLNQTTFLPNGKNMFGIIGKDRLFIKKLRLLKEKKNWRCESSQKRENQQQQQKKMIITMRKQSQKNRRRKNEASYSEFDCARITQYIICMYRYCYRQSFHFVSVLFSFLFFSFFAITLLWGLLNAAQRITNFVVRLFSCIFFNLNLLLFLRNFS